MAPRTTANRTGASSVTLTLSLTLTVTLTLALTLTLTLTLLQPLTLPLTRLKGRVSQFVTVQVSARVGMAALAR